MLAVKKNVFSAVLKLSKDGELRTEHGNRFQPDRSYQVVERVWWYNAFISIQHRSVTDRFAITSCSACMACWHAITGLWKQWKGSSKVKWRPWIVFLCTCGNPIINMRVFVCVYSQLCDELNKKAGDDASRRKTNGKRLRRWPYYTAC